MELSLIYAPVQEDLLKVRDTIRSISRIDYRWLADQLGYLVKETGKALRPALTLLSGKSYEYNLAYLLPMSVSVELMHTATLVHDDAIDNAITRRGQATINSIWGDEIAILMGDYLFAKAGEFVSDTQTPRVIKLFSQTLGIISSGEIGQFRGAFNFSQNREDYFRRIYGKTASLFSLSTQSGAILSKAPSSTSRRNGRYGTASRTFTRCSSNGASTSSRSRAPRPCGVSYVCSAPCERACRRLNALPDTASRQALYNMAEFVVEREV